MATNDKALDSLKKQLESIQSQMGTLKPEDKERRLDLQSQRIEIQKRILKLSPKEEAATQLLIVPEHLRQMRDNKSLGYFQMNPKDFLDLTVDSAQRRQSILDEALTVGEYNKSALDGSNILPPWLEIQSSKDDRHFPYGKVQGHEGRHRAAACIKAGLRRMPVFIQAKFGFYSQYKKRATFEERQQGESDRMLGVGDLPQILIGQFVPTRKLVEYEGFVPLFK